LFGLWHVGWESYKVPKMQGIDYDPRTGQPKSLYDIIRLKIIMTMVWNGFMRKIKVRINNDIKNQISNKRN
jgi:hypothetical protein